MCPNPGNPTGAVLTPEEMRLMVDIAKDHDLFIIGDEAYREFVYAGEPLQSLGEFADAADNNTSFAVQNQSDGFYKSLIESSCDGFEFFCFFKKDVTS